MDSIPFNIGLNPQMNSPLQTNLRRFTNEVHYVAVAKVLLAHGADVNARGLWKETPLHCAVFAGRPRMVEFLLSAKADLAARDVNGKSALDLATATGAPGQLPTVAAGRKECADLLRGARQVQAPDIKIQKLPQRTNAPSGERKP